MNTNELVKWINKLIEANELWKFYKSIEFRRLKEEVLIEQHYECQECKKKGIITKANTVHHVQFVRKHPELALSKYYTYKGKQYKNLIAVCKGCHNRLTQKREKDLIINKINSITRSAGNMCKAEGCNNKPDRSGKGYCRKHYDQYRKLGYVTELKSIYDRNEIEVLDDYAVIKIRNRDNETIAEGLIDIEDIDKVKDIKWRLHNNGYIQGTTNGKRIGYIHRYILEYKGEKEIDHINRNKLDNRKINLRIVNHSINASNKDPKAWDYKKKTIRCIELDKTFNSIVEATKYFKGKSCSAISNSLNGRSETAYGHHWEYIF